MDKLLKFLTKYWVILSIVATVISSLATWSLHLKSRIDGDEDTIGDLKQWVASHDDDLQTLKEDNIKLKEDERLRELGLLK